MKTITAVPLTRSAFAAFGDVIETQHTEPIGINAGSALRFHDLARVDAAREGGGASISIFVGQPFAAPLGVTMMERHPLGSQAFVPLDGRAFLVVVAPNEHNNQPGEPQAFMAGAGQGVNYRAGVWHHPLIALGAQSRFLVVDRVGEGVAVELADYPAGGYLINW